MKRNLENMPECDLIDNHIIHRLRMGLHTHVLVTGLQGKGKSSFGIRLGERLSKRIKNGVDFNHRDIVGSLLALIKRIREIRSFGEIIVIEEVSVLFPSKRGMGNQNMAVGMILDTIRKKRAILVSNAPIYTSIDSHMRALSEILVECKKVYKKRGLVKAKAWKLQTAPHTGKTYRHRFKRNGRVVMEFYSKSPNADIWAKYEKDKDKFLDDLYLSLQQKEEARLDREIPKKVKEGAEFTPAQAEIVRLRVERGLEVKEIAKELGITLAGVYDHIKRIRKKDPNITFYSTKKPFQAYKEVSNPLLI